MEDNITVEVVAGHAGRPIEGKEWKEPKAPKLNLNEFHRRIILWSLPVVTIIAINRFLVRYWSCVYGNNQWTKFNTFNYNTIFLGWRMWWDVLNADIRASLPDSIYDSCNLQVAIYFAIFCILLKYFSFSRIDREKANAIMKTKGTSHWANETEIIEIGLLNNEDGVVIGGYSKNSKLHYLRHSGTEHIICVAPSRSGKGVGLVIPTLLDWTESVIVLDLKGENYIATSGYRRNVMNQYTLRFEPTWTPEKEISAMYDGDVTSMEEADMLSTARYNPLEEIRIGTGDEVRDIQNVAELLIASDGGSSSAKDPFWDNSAIALLTGAIAFELYRKREENEDPNPNIGNVRVALQSGDMKEMFNRWKQSENYDEIFAVRYSDYFYTFDDIKPRYDKIMRDLKRAKSDWERYKQIDDAQAEEFQQKYEAIQKEREELMKQMGVNKLAFEKANQMLANADNTLSSIIATVNSKLKVWDDPAISANTSHATFHIKDLVNADRPVSFFLTIYPNDIDRLRPLMRILLSQVCSTLAGKMKRENDGRIGSGYKHKLLLMLDEFPQLKKMDFLQSGFAYFSGYGIRAYIICQDLEQLEDVYGKNETITSNCHVQIYYAPNKDATARKISEKCGKTTVVVKNTSSSGNKLGLFKTGESISFHSEETNLLNPTQVMNEVHKTANGVPGDSIIFITGHNPIFATQTPYYLDKAVYPRSQLNYPRDNSIIATTRKRLSLTDNEIKKKANLYSAPIWEGENMSREEELQETLDAMEEIDDTPCTYIEDEGLNEEIDSNSGDFAESYLDDISTLDNDMFGDNNV